MTESYHFKMCKYCGNRIGNIGFDRWGKPAASGAYCSRDCADAVHGFDNRLESERRNKTVSFNPASHDRACTQTKTPAEIMMDEEESPEPIIENPSAINALEKARKIDKRLPDILMGIANGETQEQAARRWGIDQAIVSKLIKRLRASV